MTTSLVASAWCLSVIPGMLYDRKIKHGTGCAGCWNVGFKNGNMPTLRYPDQRCEETITEIRSPCFNQQPSSRAALPAEAQSRIKLLEASPPNIDEEISDCAYCTTTGLDVFIYADETAFCCAGYWLTQPVQYTWHAIKNMSQYIR